MKTESTEPNIQTFRASSMREALLLVRQALGPDAAVLSSRPVQKSRLFGWLPSETIVEVTASAGANVPSRLKPDANQSIGNQNNASQNGNTAASSAVGATPAIDVNGTATATNDMMPAGNLRSQGYPQGPCSQYQNIRANLNPMEQSTLIGTTPAVNINQTHQTAENITPTININSSANIHSSAVSAPECNPQTLSSPLSSPLNSPWASMLEDIQNRHNGLENLTAGLFKAYNSLLDADISESVAKDLICRARYHLHGMEANHLPTIFQCLYQLIVSQIAITGPIVPSHRGYLVALVGPTGVGKTTTIAKLAAHYCLNEHRNVGLITVDTYRIAAVEQLRVYARIIDLPMLVVRNQQEMRQAVSRMRNLDLILMDTAGRGAKDELKIQELKTFLDQAQPDEVQLVLSGTSGARSLCLAADTFSQAGITSLTITKLDEVVGLGNLLPLLKTSKLPLTYITNGQSVPEDFEPADPRKLAHMVLGK